MFARDNILAILPFLNKFAIKLTKDTDKAQDLVQDTLVKVLEKESYFDGTNLQAWAGKIMFNTFCTSLRHLKRAYNGDPEHVFSTVAVSPRQEGVLYAKQVLEAVQALPAHQRDSILGYGVGYTYEEISKSDGTPVGTVRSRIARARENLQNV